MNDPMNPSSPVPEIAARASQPAEMTTGLEACPPAIPPAGEGVPGPDANYTQDGSRLPRRRPVLAYGPGTRTTSHRGDAQERECGCAPYGESRTAPGADLTGFLSPRPHQEGSPALSAPVPGNNPKPWQQHAPTPPHEHDPALWGDIWGNRPRLDYCPAPPLAAVFALMELRPFNGRRWA